MKNQSVTALDIFNSEVSANNTKKEIDDFSALENSPLQRIPRQEKRFGETGSDFIGGDEQGFDAEYLKRANRVIRRQVSKEEYERLMQERNQLVEKKYQDGLDKKETTRLQMLRWKIEGIEDAIAGPHLDKMEAIADNQEKLAEMVKSFNEQLKSVIKNYPKR